MLLKKGNSKHNAWKSKLPLNNSLSKIRVQYRKSFKDTVVINFLYFFRKGLFAGMKLKKKKKGEKGLTIANKDALGMAS